MPSTIHHTASGRYGGWPERSSGYPYHRPPASCDDRPVSRSVLVVDDDATFRELASRMLAGSGFQVVGEASSVAEALTRAGELRPDAALVDIALPDGDGFSLARRLRELSLRVVLTSTDAGATSESALRRSGATGFLPKHQLSGQALRRLLEDG
jgi:CheY-like chemotaxis protein